MTITLEGRAMTDRGATHDHLAQRLSLPGWYGRNLDALYDLLTDIGTDTELVLTEPELVEAQMGKYGAALLSTLQEAAENNPHLTVTLK